MHRAGLPRIFAPFLCSSPSRSPSISCASLLSRQLHTSRARMSRPSPPADSPPTKKARTTSPARFGLLPNPPPPSASAQDVPMDALDSGGAPALVPGGTSAPPPKLKKQGKKRQKGRAPPEACSPEDVLRHDVEALLGAPAVRAAEEEGTEWDAPFGMREEVEVEVKAMASNGEGLGVVQGRKAWAVLVPFALPGERVRARVYRSARLHSFADLLEVQRKNGEWRDDGRVRCQYFGKCAGCQYQMLSYEKQLELKRDVVVKAYQNFSDLPPSDLPPILDTLGSPLQYGYRTKITPHFDAAPKRLQGKGQGEAEGEQPEWLKIGFNQIGTRHVMDIEECPIATPVINAALTPARESIIKKAYSYKKGVSLLFRDSLPIPSASTTPPTTTTTSPTTPPTPLSASTEAHICVTDHRSTVRERVGATLFEYVAGSFFQNNNSVLVPLTSYVRTALFPPSLPGAQRPTHLVDAYCGAGLFALMLSPDFAVVSGIELSAESIRAATNNAALNRERIPEGRCTFRAGDAASIFDTVRAFPRAHTALVIDPPRKGCDENFVDQLVDFACATVVYVSCNVHTQARDVGMILRKMAAREGGRRYVLESLRGFDLFPQTAHVESVAVLRLVDA